MWTNDCDFLASASEDGTLTLWDMKSKKLAKRIAVGSPVSKMVWHPALDRTIIYGTAGGKAELRQPFLNVNRFETLKRFMILILR